MKTQTITSKNLLHVFKRNLVNAHEINRYIKTNPQTNRRIGSLPVDFFSTIANENKTGITQQAGDIFERFSLETGAIEETSDLYVFEIESVAQRLVNALKSLLKRDDIETSYVDSGSYKNCQKLKIGNYSYALSTFKRYPVFDMRGYFRPSHGKGNEPQNIFTAYKRFSQGRICRPFLAKISGENDEGGFILSKFIEANNYKKTERGPFATKRDFLQNTDIRGNSVNGIFIEAGGFVPNSKEIKNHVIRTEWRNFAECLDSNINVLKKPNANIIQDELITALNNGFDICDNETLNTLFAKRTKDDLKTARKLVKNLVRIKRLKQESINNGHFDTIKQLLKEDLCDLFPFDIYSEEFSEKQTLPEIYSGYPRLLVQELGINNVPSLKKMLYLLEDNACTVNIDFNKYYTKQEVLELFAKHNKEIKNLYALDCLIESMKIDYKNPVS